MPKPHSHRHHPPRLSTFSFTTTSTISLPSQPVQQLQKRHCSADDLLTLPVPPMSVSFSPTLPSSALRNATKKIRLLDPYEQKEKDGECVDIPTYISIERLPTDGVSDVSRQVLVERALAVTDLVSTSTLGGEKFVRTYHPVFADKDFVGLFTHPAGYRVAGLFVHILPIALVPFHHSGYADSFHTLDPRCLLGEQTISRIMSLFPYSIGCRVYKAGFISILVRKGKLRMIQETVLDWPGHRLGGLIVGLEEWSVEQTSDELLWGTSASKENETFMSMGTVGVKLRRRDGLVALTVATHAFVRRALQLTVHKNSLKEWTKRLLITTALSRPVSSLAKARPTAWCLNKLSDCSSIGKLVYLNYNKKAIGRISISYDTPSAVVPYPYGYNHDLSLIVQETEPLPNILPPVKGPRLASTFARPERALAESSVFTMRQRVSLPGKPEVYSGKVISEEQKEEPIEACEYTWMEGVHKRFLLCRTPNDAQAVDGASGSVLCLGTPKDQTVEPICFQNFETPFPFPWNLDTMKPQPLDQYRPTIEAPPGPESLMTICPINFQLKGGFFLPDDIQSSTILTTQPESQTWSGGYPSAMDGADGTAGSVTGVVVGMGKAGGHIKGFSDIGPRGN
ncbi:hypothetical protein BJ508DRAFT_330394 [Ascobolus immersus RN42]|uniref:Uncharacterized protein n=1 Tax=Ascobolus immersus RN42 TaxID=1160509 RepID=A0A3N4HVS9_ASCIM|nr:hypothetical protein BJ508DRAFT_330394 [Ascobolus immersus RN42]